MTNEEWLNGLNTEEKAKLIAKGDCCIYAGDECKGCVGGITEWLKTEHVEPMPKLKNGDLLRFKFKNGIREYNASVVGEGYMYSSDCGYGILAKTNDNHYKITEVWRFNGKVLSIIWRVAND